MLVVINGKKLSVPDKATVLAAVQALMASKNISPENVIVSVNDNVINRSLWDGMVLKADDRIEVIRIVGGG